MNIHDTAPAAQPAVLWTTHEETLTLEGEPVLIYRLSWPQLKQGRRGRAKINRYYRALIRSWKRRWDQEIYWKACLDLVQQRSVSRPFTPWRGELSGTVTYWRDGLLSIRMEGWETRGSGHPCKVRWGDVWRIKEGAPVSLRELFSKKKNWKLAVKQEILQQGHKLQADGECVFHSDWESQITPLLPSQDFCLTEEGLELTYPQGTLAPAVEGTPVFCLAVPPNRQESEHTDAACNPKKFFSKFSQKK